MDSLSEIATYAMVVLIKTSMPILLIALGVGLIISLLQALTQMQEATLSFVPKILTIFVALIFLSGYMSSQLSALFTSLIDNIIVH
jgi:flagellar biosynthetic protein FliQ